MTQITKENWPAIQAERVELAEHMETLWQERMKPPEPLRGKTLYDVPALEALYHEYELTLDDEDKDENYETQRDRASEIYWFLVWIADKELTK